MTLALNFANAVSGCRFSSTSRVSYDFDDLLATVERVELVYINSWSSETERDIEIIKVFESEEIKEVIYKLSNFEFFYSGRTPFGVESESVILFYLNGNVEIISEKAYRVYDSLGYQIGGSDFRDVVEVRKWRDWINSFR